MKKEDVDVTTDVTMDAAADSVAAPVCGSLSFCSAVAEAASAADAVDVEMVVAADAATTPVS